MLLIPIFLIALDETIKQAPAEQQGSSDQRIKLSQHQSLTKKFTEVMTQYNEIQMKYKQKHPDSFCQKASAGW